MRIGIDMRMAATGEGIARYCEELVKNLSKIDKVNDYFLIEHVRANPKFKIQNPKFRTVMTQSDYYSWAEQTKFIAELKRLKLDLMHFPNFNVPIFYPDKFIITIHDIIHHFYPGKKKSRFFHRLAYKAAIWAAVKRSAQVIAVSQATKKDLLKEFRVHPEKIKVIYEGVSFTRPDGTSRSEDPQTLSKYDIHKPYILAVGVWRQYKNLPNLARAFDILRQRHGRDYHLVLAGKVDGFYPEIQTEVYKIDSREEIRSPGHVPESDLQSLYANAKVFVLPSLIEGFGLTGVEAQRFGLPVCASDIPVLREILGSGAVYFDPRDPEDMAEKINFVLTNNQELEKLVIAGQKNVRRYSWDKTAEQTLNVYNESV